MPRRIRPALALCALLAAAGCGGTAEGSPVAAAPTASSTAAPSSTAPSTEVATPVPSDGRRGPKEAPPAGLRWYDGLADGFEVALPLGWELVELTDPRWRADLDRRGAEQRVDVAPLGAVLDAVQVSGGVLSAVEMEGWRAGSGPVISIGRASGYGTSLDDWEASMRPVIADQGGEQVEFSRVSNDRGEELLHVTYGVARTNVFTSQFVLLDRYGTAWTITFGGPGGEQLVDQATVFDEVVSTFEVG